MRHLGICGSRERACCTNALSFLFPRKEGVGGEACAWVLLQSLDVPPHLAMKYKGT